MYDCSRTCVVCRILHFTTVLRTGSDGLRNLWGPAMPPAQNYGKFEGNTHVRVCVCVCASINLSPPVHWLRWPPE
jgi:hypothetical protein